MAITSTPNLEAYFDTLNKAMRRNILDALKYLGIEETNYVRDRGAEESWHDITGNLRSSIGWAIYENGQKQNGSSFPVVKDGTEGAKKGQECIAKIAGELSGEMALAIVAGMDYASYVEAMDGKDVLASAETHVRAKIGQDINVAIENAIAVAEKVKL